MMGLEGFRGQCSAQLLHGPGRRGKANGRSPFVICPVVKGSTAQPKRIFPDLASAESHPPRDTTRLTFTL